MAQLEEARDISGDEQSFSSRVSVGDIIVSQTGTRRKVLNKVVDKNKPGGGYFIFERTRKSGEKKREELSFDHMDNTENAVEYVVSEAEEQGAQEKFEEEKGGYEPEVGDLIVSKSGTRREVLEINKEKPGGEYAVVRRYGGNGSVREENLSIAELRKASKNIDYFLNRDQRMKVGIDLRRKREQYAKIGFGWDEVLFRNTLERGEYLDELEEKKKEIYRGKLIK